MSEASGIRCVCDQGYYGKGCVELVSTTTANPYITFSGIFQKEPRSDHSNGDHQSQDVLDELVSVEKLLPTTLAPPQALLENQSVLGGVFYSGVSLFGFGNEF